MSKSRCACIECRIGAFTHTVRVQTAKIEEARDAEVRAAIARLESRRVLPDGAAVSIYWTDG